MINNWLKFKYLKNEKTLPINNNINHNCIDSRIIGITKVLSKDSLVGQILISIHAILASIVSVL